MCIDKEFPVSISVVLMGETGLIWVCIKHL